MAYIDNAQTLYVLDLTTGTPKKVAADRIVGPVSTLTFGWSPDSRWLVVLRQTRRPSR